MDGVRVHHCTHQCVPPSRCFSPPMVLCAGPSLTAVTGFRTWCGAQIWVYSPRCSMWLQTQAWAWGTRRNKGRQGWDEVLTEEGMKTSPTPWPGLCNRAGGCRATSSRHLLSPAALNSADSCSRCPCQHLSTQHIPIPTGAGSGGHEEHPPLPAGSLHPRPAASSSSSPHPGTSGLAGEQ